MKKYFFSYSYTLKRQYDTIAGFGNCEMELNHPPSSIEQMDLLADQIKEKTGNSTVMILYYREF
jgi:hypothetical protein